MRSTRRSRPFVLTCLCLALAGAPRGVLAGPPFATDDPEPTEYQHWEIYLGGTYDRGDGRTDASLPFGEFNYGLMPNVQFSFALPLDAHWIHGLASQFGYGATDVGLKLRFIPESRGMPQVAFYPSVQLPTSGNGGSAATLLPVWLQKSWGPWTVYGGAGRWLNPGAGDRNWTFGGLTVLRSLSHSTTLGVEGFSSSASSARGRGSTGFNVGGLVTFDEHHGVVASVGRAFDASHTVTAYAAYELMLGR